MTGQPNRFLLFNNGMIGNTLFNMPVAAWLKGAFPGCFVGMVVDRAGLDLVGADPNVDVFHTFNKKRDSLARQFRLVCALRREQYDVSLHLRRGVRNEVLARLAGVGLRAGYALRGSWQHLHVTVDEDMSVHRLASRAQLVEAALGRPVTLDRPRLHPSPEAEAEVRGLLAGTGMVAGTYLVVHPTGDSQGGIGWSLPVWAGVVARLSPSVPVFIVCMPHERAAVEQAIPEGERVRYYTGSVAATAELVRRAGVFAGNDSGPAHLACAWGTLRLVVYLDDAANFAKWRPASDEGCLVVFQPAFTVETVVAGIQSLRNTARVE
ncbi:MULTISPECIES: glycosyltransferase family 9 protein [Pseudodesulfovibrio]|uniref:Glycosyl transferase family 9 n=1 Tax=Pseudodesulfovibrio aespoeensis (strain ATCC 700646 / DSM 10631 / Aspo-2) TaxID=643562 RepID=E6VVQ7_PSEA9|nr:MULTISPECIES: glycosyltransferase family 9 protein [Pseudodesulfovibrio]ADU61259.1 glycosyl transferase family 9 [Pseudodesulfovibrio aespoeensis Aspo-2]MCG2733450.1 glycosyltransferase family 9 protein [Pseudodesulfovibrio aespoeensis]